MSALSSLSVLRRIARPLFLTVTLLAGTLSYAQGIQTNYDKKVLYCDSLNMPQNTHLGTLINILPELLQRPGDFILSNYDVQVEGMSVGSATDVILQQLYIMDIERVEVDESPVSNYTNNGQGGTINLILRDHGSSRRDDLWGSAGVAATTEPDLSPLFNIGYKTPKFMVRGLLLGEVFNNNPETITQNFTDGKLTGTTHSEKEERFRTELARAYMQYRFNSHDLLKFNVSESHTYDRVRSVTDYNTLRAVTNKNKATDLHSFLRYEHKKGRHELAIVMEHHFSPSSNDYAYIAKNRPNYYEETSTRNILAGKAEYKAMLFNQLTQGGETRQGKLTVGANYNANITNDEIGVSDDNIASKLAHSKPETNTYYLMPYMMFETTLGKLKLKASGEYQVYEYDIASENHTTVDNVSSSFTGRFIAEWYFKPTRHLRLAADRKLQRPSGSQLFPYLTYAPTTGKYSQGNPDLTPMMCHELRMDYFDNFQWGNDHRLSITASASYNWVSDIIASINVGKNPEPGTLGQTLHYTSYINRDRSQLAIANVMGLYTYKMFSVSLVGNLYHKMFDNTTSTSHSTYYNIALNPYFRLKDGWQGGASFTYYSSVHESNAKLGDCAVARMTVGKSVGNWFFFLNENVNITQKSKDVTTNGPSVTTDAYQMVTNSVGAGVRYSF